MLVGTDYIITYDRILQACGTRFAWNICPDDEMPFIYHIRGSGGSINLTVPKTGFVRGSLTTMIKSEGSNMALVTHKAGVQVLPNKRVKGEPPLPYVHVKTEAGEDYVFQVDVDVQFADSKMSFSGQAGVIRRRSNGETEVSIFHGKEIGVGEVSLAVDNPDLGIGASWSRPNEAAGVFFSRSGGTLTLKIPGAGRFYVDGAPFSGAANQYKLPPGEHRWEFTSRLPEPMPPVMLRTENRSGGATVFFTRVAGAEKYRLEVSRDNGLTWIAAGETAVDRFELKGFPNETKIHVRAIALNRDRQSRPANEYPVYVSAKPALSPDGLKTTLGEDRVKLTWGEILGVTEYRLYRREKTVRSEFREIFRGRANEYVDTVKVPPAYDSPGLQADAMRDTNALVYEYVVSAVNGNGEGEKSLPTDTDPRSWRNWNPVADLRYKRQSGFWLPPYVRPEDVPPPYYP